MILAEEKIDHRKKRSKSLITPDIKLYPPDWDKLVPTQVRIFPGDWNKFQTYKELKGNMSEILRKLLHDFLKYNGYSQSELIQRIRGVDGEIQSLAGEKASMELQLRDMLQKKFDKEEVELDKERRTLLTIQLKVMWAERLYILRKSASLQGKERTPKEDLDWVQRQLKGAEELRDFADTPDLILKEMEDIIKKQEPKFEAKFSEQYIEPRRSRRGRG